MAGRTQLISVEARQTSGAVGALADPVFAVCLGLGCCHTRTLSVCTTFTQPLPQRNLRRPPELAAAPHLLLRRRRRLNWRRISNRSRVVLSGHVVIVRIWVTHVYRIHQPDHEIEDTGAPTAPHSAKRITSSQTSSSSTPGIQRSQKQPSSQILSTVGERGSVMSTL